MLGLIVKFSDFILNKHTILCESPPIDT